MVTPATTKRMLVLALLCLFCMPNYIHGWSLTRFVPRRLGRFVSFFRSGEATTSLDQHNHGFQDLGQLRRITTASTVTSPLIPPSGTGYIPDGLSQEQYHQIKLQEQQQQAAMSKNLGAFGPRFLPSDRPDGDWLLQPQLWINGKQQQQERETSSRHHSHNKKHGSILPDALTTVSFRQEEIDRDGESLEDLDRPLRPVTYLLKQTFPSFLLAFLLVQLLSISVQLVRNSSRHSLASSKPLVHLLLYAAVQVRPRAKLAAALAVTPLLWQASGDRKRLAVRSAVMAYVCASTWTVVRYAIAKL